MLQDYRIKATWLLKAILAAKTRYVVLEGGTRSSKTISLAQAMMLLCGLMRGEIVSIARKTLPALRISAMRDFFKILHNADEEFGVYPSIYDESAHSKGLNTYEINTNTVEFMSVDDPQKKRGSGRKILWVNEANELTEDDARQLFMRTKGQIYIDYNPSESPEHWIHQNILSLPPSEVTVIHSTYLDNPFLPLDQVREIERLKDQDPVAWSVFGLGKWAQLRGKIYTNWSRGETMPEGGVYGIDFGHTVPTAVVKVNLQDGTLYWSEEVYETNMTNTDLIQRLKAQGVPQGSILYCDAAEPDRIEELRRAGFQARAAKKDVMTGIDFCRRYPIVAIGPNICKELGSYKMKQNAQGDTLDEPLKYNDHAMDAARYATFSHYFVPPVKSSYKTVVSREAKFEGGAW
jgi:phage terminase large subunit